MANFLSRLLPWIKTKTAVGGAYWLPVTGAWLPSSLGNYMNWWQMGDVTPACSQSAMLEACVSAYSQTIAMCPGDHWRSNDNGGRDRVVNSALSRILRRPNTYQSISDFMLNAVRSLYLEGNAYALGVRNDRFEIDELHLMNPRECAAQIAETGEIFYSLAGNAVIEKQVGAPFMVPQRDVLHIRLHTTRNMLKGESPIMAAALDLAAGNAITAQQLAFYNNQARPSTVLTTDLVLTAEQAETIRTRYNEKARGLESGGTVVLSQGVKPFQLTTSPRDAELTEVLKLTEQHIALAYRIPLQLLGIGETPFASTEALMQFWLASGLGFAINHVEEAFGVLFGLRGVPDDYVEFNTAALLRTAEKDRMEALSKSIRGGIRTINEARALEGLSRIDGGDDIRVQQQDVPLDWHEQQAKLQQQQDAPPPSDDDEESSSEASPEEQERGANDNEQIRRGFRAAYDRQLAL